MSLRQPGVAVIDYAYDNEKCYSFVVSTTKIVGTDDYIPINMST